MPDGLLHASSKPLTGYRLFEMRLKIDEEDLRCSSQNPLLSGNRSIFKSLSKLVKSLEEITLEHPRISIRRRMAGATGGRAPFRVRSKDRLHLLFVVSRPEGAGFIDPRADAQAVLDALTRHAPSRVTWEFLRLPTLDALVKRL